MGIPLPNLLKMSAIAPILLFVLVSNVASLAVEKAASPYTNLGCQCSSLTFVDSSGHIQGNCKRVDSTGAQWCYVDSHHSSCQDLVYSARFPNNPWSYEACATPAVLPAVHPVPVHTGYVHQPVHAGHIHQPVHAGHVHQPVHQVHPVGHNIYTAQPSGALIPKTAVEQPTK